MATLPICSGMGWRRASRWFLWPPAAWQKATTATEERLPEPGSWSRNCGALAAFLGRAFTRFHGGSPSLFLNLWMAATKCIMKAAEGVEGSGLITAAGGNGRDVGIQVSGLAGCWFTAPASPPKGSVQGVPADRALGAIGDSAIVDAYGLGAMAVNLSPGQQKAFEAVLPVDAALRRRQLPVGRHVGLGSSMSASGFLPGRWRQPACAR